MEDDISIDDLSNEKELLKKIQYFRTQVTNLENLIKPFSESEIYGDLSNEDRIKYDIFLSYSVTSLYWMYIRTCGIDPFEHTVKNEVDRVQEYMKEYQKVKDRKKAPHIDVGAAKRFIKHGLYDPDQALAAGKRKTFSDSEEESDE